MHIYVWAYIDVEVSARATYYEQREATTQRIPQGVAQNLHHEASNWQLLRIVREPFFTCMCAVCAGVRVLRGCGGVAGRRGECLCSSMAKAKGYILLYYD